MISKPQIPSEWIIIISLVSDMVYDFTRLPIFLRSDSNKKKLICYIETKSCCNTGSFVV